MILIMASLTQKMIKYEGVVIRADQRRVIRRPYFVIIPSQANGWDGPGLSLGSVRDKYKITLELNKPLPGHTNARHKNILLINEGKVFNTVYFIFSTPRIMCKKICVLWSIVTTEVQKLVF